MPKCTICNHPQRSAIEQLLFSGAPQRSIAREFCVSHDSIQRHAATHIQEALHQSQAAKDEAQSLDVVKQLVSINTSSLAILREAQESGDAHLALKAIDRIAKQIEIQAKLLGEIDTTRVNVQVSAEWKMIRQALIDALAPYADARIAAASALMRLEGAIEP